MIWTYQPNSRSTAAPCRTTKNSRTGGVSLQRDMAPGSHCLYGCAGVFGVLGLSPHSLLLSGSLSGTGSGESGRVTVEKEREEKKGENRHVSQIMENMCAPAVLL